jgi:hypothetical protein
LLSAAVDMVAAADVVSAVVVVVDMPSPVAAAEVSEAAGSLDVALRVVAEGSMAVEGSGMADTGTVASGSG